MLICGIKVSHDGAVAVIDDDRLLFSIEVEKLNNGRRYSGIDDFVLLDQILAIENIRAQDVDSFVIDGWYPPGQEQEASVNTVWRGQPLRLPVAPYVDSGRDVVTPLVFPGVPGTALSDGYVSYTHAAGHVLGAYCASPFARAGEEALVLSWDGGMLPQLFRADAARGRVQALGPLFPFVGNVFVGFCHQFEPYLKETASMTEEQLTRYELEVPGKAMAYAALGRVDDGVFSVFDELFDETLAVSVEAATRLGRAAAARRDELFPGLSNADLIASFQAYIGQVFLDSFEQFLNKRSNDKRENLCFTGGCALNIKWNSLLRDSGLFRAIWIPPFANDSGGAIGAACCEMVRQGGNFPLDWDVFSGPDLKPEAPPRDWTAATCSEQQLAQILHETAEPVVVLQGRAELGPRALGNRSILAPAYDPGIKERINDIKKRASYRPVAPICLESRADEVFAPGGRDPYMLFEHRLRGDWAQRIPGIIHLDGTARLQTVDPSTQNMAVARILLAYERLSGIPVLCNTSANMCGHGFFPDAATAAAWGRIRNVWSNGTLFTNPSPAAFCALPHEVSSADKQ